MVSEAQALEVSCIVFAWNEVKTLEIVVRELGDVLTSLALPYEIVIVDDGSSDGTSELADRLATDAVGVRVVHHGDNRGLGEVYRTGFSEARGRFVTFFPADNQFPAENVRALHAAAAAGSDFVLGNLERRPGSALGAVLSRVERLLYAAMFGRLPRLEGIFMVKRDVLQAVPLESRGRGWGIVMELLIKAHRAGFRLVGARITMRPRQVGRSKVNNLSSIATNTWQLAKLRASI